MTCMNNSVNADIIILATLVLWGGHSPLIQRALQRLHADIVGDRTADNQQRRRPAGTGRRPVEIEVRLVHCLECGDQDREVFRQAPRHDGIDRGGMHRFHDIAATKPLRQVNAVVRRRFVRDRR